VIDGETVFTEEVVWDPRNQTDPQCHFEQDHGRAAARRRAYGRVLTRSGSSPGVIINSRRWSRPSSAACRRDKFETGVQEHLPENERGMGNPLRVANDGDVTALAGAMSS